jgi:hypothetical protein
MPKAAPLPELKGVEMAEDVYTAARDAHALVILTEWNEFRTLDLAKLKRVMKAPVLCDLRNIYEPEEIEAAGWTHYGVGKGRAGKAAKPAAKRGASKPAKPAAARPVRRAARREGEARA